MKKWLDKFDDCPCPPTCDCNDLGIDITEPRDATGYNVDSRKYTAPPGMIDMETIEDLLRRRREYDVLREKQAKDPTNWRISGAIQNNLESYFEKYQDKYPLYEDVLAPMRNVGKFTLEQGAEYLGGKLVKGAYKKLKQKYNKIQNLENKIPQPLKDKINQMYGSYEGYDLISDAYDYIKQSEEESKAGPAYRKYLEKLYTDRHGGNEQGYLNYNENYNPSWVGINSPGMMEKITVESNPVKKAKGGSNELQSYTNTNTQSTELCKPDEVWDPVNKRCVPWNKGEGFRHDDPVVEAGYATWDPKYSAYRAYDFHSSSPATTMNAIEMTADKSSLWDDFRRSYFNPFNWGMNDYGNDTDTEISLDAARAAARADFRKDFMYNNRRYTTDRGAFATTPQKQAEIMRQYGYLPITNEDLFDKDPEENKKAYSYKIAEAEDKVREEEYINSYVQNYLKDNPNATEGEARERALQSYVKSKPLPSGAITPVMGPVEYALGAYTLGPLLGAEIGSTGLTVSNVANPVFFGHGVYNFANPDSDFNKSLQQAFKTGEADDWKTVGFEGGLNALNFLGIRSLGTDLAKIGYTLSPSGKFVSTTPTIINNYQPWSSTTAAGDFKFANNGNILPAATEQKLLPSSTDVVSGAIAETPTVANTVTKVNTGLLGESMLNESAAAAAEGAQGVTNANNTISLFPEGSKQEIGYDVGNNQITFYDTTDEAAALVKNKKNIYTLPYLKPENQESTLKTKQEQKDAVDFANKFSEQWVYKDPSKNKQLGDASDEAVEAANLARQQIIDDVDEAVLREYADSKGLLPEDGVLPEDVRNSLINDLDLFGIRQNLSAKYYLPGSATSQRLQEIDDELFRKTEEIRAEYLANIDPTFLSKIESIYAEAGQTMPVPNPFIDMDIMDFATRSKLTYPGDITEPVNISKEAKDLIENNRDTMGGVNMPSTNESITLGNTTVNKGSNKITLTVPHINTSKDAEALVMALKKDPSMLQLLPGAEAITARVLELVDPYYIRKTAAHENYHSIQNLFNDWRNVIDKNDIDYGYYVVRSDNKIAQEFKNALIEPVKDPTKNRTTGYTDETYKANVTELGANLMMLRTQRAFELVNQGNLTLEQAIAQLKNPVNEEIDLAMWADHPDISRHFKPETSQEERVRLLKYLAAIAAGTTAGAKAMNDDKSNKD